METGRPRPPRRARGFARPGFGWARTNCLTRPSGANRQARTAERTRRTCACAPLCAPGGALIWTACRMNSGACKALTGFRWWRNIYRRPCPRRARCCASTATPPPAGGSFRPWPARCARRGTTLFCRTAAAHGQSEGEYVALAPPTNGTALPGPMRRSGASPGASWRCTASRWGRPPCCWPGQRGPARVCARHCGRLWLHQRRG